MGKNANRNFGIFLSFHLLLSMKTLKTETTLQKHKQKVVQQRKEKEKEKVIEKKKVNN